MPKPTTILEAILFAASGPVSLAELAELLGSDPQQTTSRLQQLDTELAERGVRLLQHRGTYQLVSAPECAEAVARFLKDQAKTELTKPALETLAIITYEQPITASRIEQLRGINSEQSIKGLLARELIQTASPDPDSGETRYHTSSRLLTHLGITSTTQLPPLPEPTDAA